MNMTYHAAIRSQQRGIPPLVMQWLDQFGEECYDGHGAIILKTAVELNPANKNQHKLDKNC